MLPTAILSGVIAAIFGTVGFAVTKDFVGSQDTSSWSAAERSIIVTAVPVGLALMVFIALFAGLSKVRGSGGG